MYIYMYIVYIALYIHVAMYTCMYIALRCGHIACVTLVSFILNLHYYTEHEQLPIVCRHLILFYACIERQFPEKKANTIKMASGPT